MMDNKTWRWKKKSSEKIIVTTDKPDHEEKLPPSEKEVALLQSVENLNEKLASAICECNAKDELLTNYEKKSQEAIADQEKAEAEAVILKQELDEALQQKEAANVRLTDLNAALKDYMQQLNYLREEQDQRIRDAVTKTSKEYEKAHKKLEEKNENLKTEKFMKEKLIEEISKRMYIAESEFKTLMSRLNSTEKENTFLKYEFRMLEKELEIRNEEVELIRRSADASRKMHVQSAKKMTKLEAECQRLRILVKKRLPSPNMKNEVEESRRRKGNHVENVPEISSKRFSFLIDQLCDIEEENKILKEIIGKKDEEIRSLRTTFDRSLMDDFVEMEKLAIISVEGPSEVSTDECYALSNSTGKELVPLTQEDSNDVELKTGDSRSKVAGYITWKSPNSSPRTGSFKEVLDIVPADQEIKTVDLIKSLETEVETLRESKMMIEGQIENQKLINEDLDTQLTVARAKMAEVLQKLSSLEVELEEKNQCCEELETTCLELQLQLESVNNKETPRADVDQEEKLLHTGWEITAASAKLAECQETIFNLGRQLKALSSSPNKSAITNTSKDLSQQRSSLRDRLIADDDSTSPKTKEIIISSTEEPKKLSSTVQCENTKTSYAPSTAAGALAIVTTKKRSGGTSFLRKLLLRRKRGSSNKPSFPFGV